MRFTLAMMMLLISFSASAKTLLVSDVDDTIKLANVASKLGAAKYALDSESRFSGMSQLYSLIRKDNEEIKIVYLSNAPTWLMENTHKDFLVNGMFPRAQYIGRSEYSSDIHKSTWLRNLIEAEMPSDVILFGDNVEKDPQVYEQMRSEYERHGIKFHVFIRTVTDAPVPQGQVKFVTPIEVSYELEERGLLSTASVDWIMGFVAPYISGQKLDQKKGNVAFPDFVQCQTFTWQNKWTQRGQDYETLLDVRKKIALRCGN